MLQIYKVLVLCRVTLDPDVKGQPEVMDPREVIGHPALMGSNVYSSCELHLLAWLNTHYQATRSSELPAARWVANFDLDLADGLVLAALLAAYCPPLVPVANPFTTDACFRVLLTELRSQAAEKDANTLSVSPEEESDPESRSKGGNGGTEAGEFFSTVTAVCLRAGQTGSLEVLFLPLSAGTKHSSLLLLCPQAQGGEPALGLRCAAGEVCEVLLHVPRVNEAREEALVLWARRRMGARERWRQQQLADAGSSVRTTAAARRVATKQQAGPLGGVAHGKGLEYSVEVSKPRHFRLPRTVTVPDRPALADEDADPDADVLDPAAAAGGKLSLVNDCDATEHTTFTLRGAGQRPLPADRVVLHCQAGQVTHTELWVPNRSRRTLTLQIPPVSWTSSGSSRHPPAGHTAAGAVGTPRRGYAQRTPATNAPATSSTASLAAQRAGFR
ncbi:hypothetical protein CRUP_019649 [Coryphaenoides rupestris]|nr:hypothetical protein CRUP_019649 [Coryphaenoides rupestris]